MSGIQAWAASAAQGDCFTYYAGNLARDRYFSSVKGVPCDGDLAEAQTAWDLMRDGAVLLVQQNISPAKGCFYNAIRTKKGAAQ